MRSPLTPTAPGARLAAQDNAVHCGPNYWPPVRRSPGRLGRELQLASPAPGSQSMPRRPCRLSPAYFSPSLPLARKIIFLIIFQMKKMSREL